MCCLLTPRAYPLRRHSFTHPLFGTQISYKTSSSACPKSPPSSVNSNYILIFNSFYCIFLFCFFLPVVYFFPFFSHYVVFLVFFLSVAQFSFFFRWWFSFQFCDVFLFVKNYLLSHHHTLSLYIIVLFYFQFTSILFFFTDLLCEVLLPVHNKAPRLSVSWFSFYKWIDSMLLGREAKNIDRVNIFIAFFLGCSVCSRSTPKGIATMGFAMLR